MITYSDLSHKFSGTNTHAFWYQEGVYAYNGLSGSEWAYSCKTDGTYEVANGEMKNSMREKAIQEDAQLRRMVANSAI